MRTFVNIQVLRFCVELVHSRPMKRVLSIITVSYGQAAQVEKLLESLKNFPPSVSWELVVVDNDSRTRQNYEFLKNEKNAYLIKLARNIGFGRGNEEGLKFSTGEIIAFINPDIELQEKTLDTLLGEIDAGIVVPRLENKKGELLESTWNFPTVLGTIRRRIWKGRTVKKNNKQTKEVEWAQGSFLVMRRDFFEKLGGFDHRFFLFFEDTDLCRRVWKAGKKVVQIPSARAFHTEHRLSGGHILTAIFKKTFWIHISSAMKYFWKYRKGKANLPPSPPPRRGRNIPPPLAPLCKGRCPKDREVF